MKSNWITHGGRRILYCDFTNFGRDAKALKVEVDAADDAIVKERKDSVFAIADLRGTTTSSEVVDMFKQSAKRTNGYVHKQAVVGVTGIQKILASAVARFSGQSFHLFDTVEEAKEWLVLDKKGKGIEIVPQ